MSNYNYGDPCGTRNHATDETRLAELEQFLADAVAFMRYCAKNGESDRSQLYALAHDLGGLSRKERCFRPRVSGYAAQGY